jgi:F-type H+-transporting ATPase subunit delta
VANQLQNRCDMIVESAAEMSASQYDELAQVFGAKTGKTVILRKRIKPELLGGARVVIGGRVYDYSVQHQMEEMQNLLMQK